MSLLSTLTNGASRLTRLAAGAALGLGLAAGFAPEAAFAQAVEAPAAQATTAASPLVTASPARPKARAKRRAWSRPPAVGRRLPTTATCGCHSRSASPARNSTAGGDGASRSRAG